MAKLLKVAAICFMLVFASLADAQDFDLSIDLRAVSSDAPQSRLTGGLGTTRLGERQGRATGFGAPGIPW